MQGFKHCCLLHPASASYQRSMLTSEALPSSGLHSTPPGTPWNAVHDVFRKLADADFKGTVDLALLKPSILDKVCNDFLLMIQERTGLTLPQDKLI